VSATPRSERPGASDEPLSRASLRPTISPLAEPQAVQVLGVSMTRFELRRTAMLFALLFLVALIFVVGRTARDALFLTKFPVSWIGPMWMAYGAASSFVALAYARYVDRLPRAPFMVVFAAIAAASFIVLRVFIGRDARPAYAVLYVVAEIIANLAAMSAWTLAQDLHDTRSAKRLFGLIGAGRVLGVVVCGFTTAALVRKIGTENLLIVLAVAMAAFAAVAVAIARRFPVAAPQADEAVAARADRTPLVRSPYVRSVALMTLLLFAILTIGDYQFKAIAQTSYASRDDLASFMANFYGVIGALGIVIQLAVTPRLLQRYGVLAGMLAMPLAFSGASLGLVLVPGLAFATLLKASDNGLQFTIHEATMQLLLFPFPSGARARVRTVVDAVFKPIGCGLGALLLLWLAPSTQASAPGPSRARPISGFTRCRSACSSWRSCRSSEPVTSKRCEKPWCGASSSPRSSLKVRTRGACFAKPCSAPTPRK
jgi:ATP/ADP translocase